MKARMFEVRVEDEVHSCMALEMDDDVSENRRWLLDRAGYVRRGEPPSMMLVFIDPPVSCQIRPANWPERWKMYVHNFVLEHFDIMYDGYVIDVDFLLDNREKPRISSRAV